MRKARHVRLFSCFQICLLWRLIFWATRASIYDSGSSYNTSFKMHAWGNIFLKKYLRYTLSFLHFSIMSTRVYRLMSPKIHLAIGVRGKVGEAAVILPGGKNCYFRTNYRAKVLQHPKSDVVQYAYAFDDS